MKKQTIFKNKKIIVSFLIIIVVLVGGSAFVAGYYFAKSNEVQKISKSDRLKTQEALKELQRLVDENVKLKQKIKEENKTKVEKTTKLVNSEAIDYQENKQIQPSSNDKKPIIYTSKPKLVIIMDDMSFSSQVKSLKNLGIKVTPSFFPPSKRHPNTAKYAKEFSHYMVHFPMQATNPNFREEVNTIHIDSSFTFIEDRVKEIKKEFPNVKFVNNHTGSKFTSNYKAMNKLYIALNKYHIIFVDSKTTSKSKAPIIAKKRHQILFSRDVFLDNKPDVAYIQNQLKKAIKLAKRKGYAIAICHPHSKTFEALAKSKNLLKNVEVIYIDELYKLYQKNKLSKL